MPGWTADQVQVTISCQAFVATGIYTALGGAAPIVTVAADDVPYPSLLGALGVVDLGIEMNATSHAAVIGI